MKLVTERSTGRTLGYGFVSFVNAETARKAIEALNGQSVDGKRLKVTLAKPREEVRYNTNIYVSGLPPTATEEWLRAMCSYHGQILELKLLTDSAARGKHDTLSGFVRYARRNESDACINAVHRSRVKAPPAPNGEDVKTTNGEPVEGREYLVSARYATDTRTRQKENEGIWISNSSGDGVISGRMSRNGHHSSNTSNSSNGDLDMNFNFENGNGDESFGKNRPQNVRGKGGLLFPNAGPGNFQYSRNGGMGGNNGKGNSSRSHSHNRPSGDKNSGGNRPFGDNNTGNQKHRIFGGEFEGHMDKNQPYYFVPNPALPGLQASHPFPVDPSNVPLTSAHVSMSAAMMNQSSFLGMYPPSMFPTAGPFADQLLTFPGSLFSPYPYDGLMSPNFPHFHNLDPTRGIPTNDPSKDGEDGDDAANMALLNSTMAAVNLNDSDKDMSAGDAKSASDATSGQTSTGTDTAEKPVGDGETDAPALAGADANEKNHTILPAAEVKPLPEGASPSLNIPLGEPGVGADGLGALPFLSMSLGPEAGVANPYFYPQIPGVTMPDMFGTYPTFGGYMIPTFPAHETSPTPPSDFPGNINFGQDVAKETHTRVGALGIPTSPRHPDLNSSHVLGSRFGVPMPPATSLEGLDSLSLVPSDMPSVEENQLLEKIRDSWNVN